MKSKLAINGGEKAVNLDRQHYVWPPITERTREAVLRQLEESISIYDRSGVIERLPEGIHKFHNTSFVVILLV